MFLPTSTLRMAEITDGVSNTYLLCEKYLNPDRYTTGDDGADNNTACVGYDWDHIRWARRAVAGHAKLRQLARLWRSPCRKLQRSSL